MKSPTRLTAAIIGFGISGELSHAYGLQANPEFEIVAVCDLSEDRRAAAEKLIGCRSFSSHQDLMAAFPQLDLACIITRSDTHKDIAVDFLSAGISCVITKPWALDEIEGEIILAAQRRGGAQLFPWVPVYWAAEFRKARELLEQDAIGKVFMIRRQLSDFRRRDDWQTRRRYGGGYLLNWGAHIVQPLVALAPGPPRRLTGHLQKLINPGDADDAFLAVIEFENDCLGIAEFTQAIESLPSLTIQGDRGMIRSDGKTLTLHQKDPATSEPPRVQRFALEGKPFGDEADVYHDIAQSLAHGRPYPVSADDALSNTRILDAIRASHENSQSITLVDRSLF